MISHYSTPTAAAKYAALFPRVFVGSSLRLPQYSWCGKIRKSAGTTAIILPILRGNFIPFEPLLVVVTTPLWIAKYGTLFIKQRLTAFGNCLGALRLPLSHMCATLHKTGRCMCDDLFCSTYAHIWLTLRKKESQSKPEIQCDDFLFCSSFLIPKKWVFGIFLGITAALRRKCSTLQLIILFYFLVKAWFFLHELPKLCYTIS